MIRPLYLHGPGPWAWSNLRQVTVYIGYFFELCRPLNFRKETVILGRAHLTLVAQRSELGRCNGSVLNIYCCHRH
jgi:hypothetical protein